MKRLILILALGFAAPAMAQDDTSEGLSLMERGAELFFRGIIQDMEPALKDLSDLGDQLAPHLERLTEEMGPAIIGLVEKVDDFRNYEAPEFLPNGDIIIRRSPDAPPYKAPEPDIDIPEGQSIEL